MFNKNNQEEKKLDWMYKGPNSTVDREEYLLGRPVDKTLVQLNDEEKQKQQGIIATPKNRVEHECIPPSIRDFNKLVQAEQVDLSTKLQEDPLVAIKKREQETRRQFLQNPVQLKKLQKALKAQQAKKKKKKKKKSRNSSDSDVDLDAKLTEKLLGSKFRKVTKEERDLDTILIHKFEALKNKLTDDDLRDILNGKITDSDDSTEEEENDKLKKKLQKGQCESSEENEHIKRRKNNDRRERRNSKKEEPSSEESEGDRRKKIHDKDRKEKKRGDDSRTKGNVRHHSHRNRSRSRSPRHRTSSSEADHPSKSKYTTKDDDSDSPKNRKLDYGLVNSEGKKIPFSRKGLVERKRTPPKAVKVSKLPPSLDQRSRARKLTEEEKEKLRREMMENAVWRDKERERNVRKYREKEEKERKEQDFDPEFMHKQLLKSANSNSVESRIKANLNNIQRSGRDMDKHFSRR